ncbi:hypothetical protein C8Q76DRAFT_714857 [Earliella scabrosa]|nr:hypothetical protein C8Q76DRAFT_714857 [Earliella scabrosa]
MFRNPLLDHLHNVCPFSTRLNTPALVRPNHLPQNGQSNPLTQSTLAYLTLPRTNAFCH